MVNKFFRIISFSFFALFSITTLTTCSFLNKPMLNELKKYTENVVFMKYELNQPTRKDKDDYLCVSSAEDLIIDYYISNPQLYSFGGNTISKNMAENYAIVQNDSNGVEHEAAVNNYMFVEQVDPNLVRVTISANYLTKIDGVKSGYGADAYNNTKGKGDIIPSVTLTESGSGRKFTSPKIKLACNSTPMPVRNLSIFRKETDISGEYKYILCFNMPDVSGIHKDVVNLTVSSNMADFTELSIPITPDPNAPDDAGIDTNSDTKFGSVDSTTMGNLIPATGDNTQIATWTGEGLPRAIYVDTGYIAEKSENVSFTITLKDYEGFSSSATVSVSATQLDVPTTNVTYTTDPTPDNSYEGVGSIDTDEETGWGTIKITAPTSNAKVHYIATNSSGDVYSGSGTGIVNAKLPGGIWTVETWAQQKGYLDSLPLVVQVAVKDKNLTTAYVVGKEAKYLSIPETTASGYFGQLGSKALPFETIQDALSVINATSVEDLGFTPNDPVPFTIMVDGKIEAESSVGNAWFIEIDDQYSNLSNRPITICGYKNTATIDAKQNGGVLNIGRATITLKDIIITGGYKTGTTGGGGVYISGGTLTLEAGAVITGNKADNNGGGIYGDIISGAEIILNPGCEISNNTSLNYGGGIAAGNTGMGVNITMKGGTIKNNSALKGGGVYATNNINGYHIQLLGGSITENIANDVGGGLYIGANGCMPLISNISITNNKGDGVYLESGSNYGSAQPSLEGKVIINDNTDSNGKARNLVFGGEFSLNDIENLVNGSKIGITKPSDVEAPYNAPFAFAGGISEDIPWETIFFSDEEGYEITRSSDSLNVVKIITIMPNIEGYSYEAYISETKSGNIKFMAFLSDGTEVTDLSEWSIIPQYESKVTDNEVEFYTCNSNNIEILNVTCTYGGVDYTHVFKVSLVTPY